MTVSGQQLKKLHAALLQSFNRSNLGLMVRFETNIKIEEIARTNGNLTEITLDVVNYFAREGRLRELLDGAIAQNPHNTVLKAVVAEAQEWDLDTPTAAQLELTATDVSIQLPPKTERFVGREELVTQVQDAVQPNRVVTLWGPGGQGKTAVAWQALTGLHESGELLQRFPDGVLFHTFYGRPLTDTALTHFAQSMGIEDVRDPIGAAQRALSGKQLLLILDGAEDADDLWRVLEVCGTCGVLITTRNQNQSPDPN